MTATTTHLHQCTVCEAACGLAFEVAGREVVSVRGDDDDVFSHGFICPKGAALRELDADPDRLRQPLVKRHGVHEPASWDEAFEAIDRGLRPLIAEHGENALGFYLGNPGAHNTSLVLYNQALLTGFRSRNRFSASTVDQYPKQVATALLFGGAFTVPVPDIDRSEWILMLGANPMASNGSLFTVPDFRGRARRLRERGGRLVVVDRSSGRRSRKPTNRRAS
jgi:anaerobic selenocysteine-containing dehydrogenase